MGHTRTLGYHTIPELPFPLWGILAIGLTQVYEQLTDVNNLLVTGSGVFRGVQPCQ